jgi:N-acetylglucosamine-6-phosphate deacetylase
MTSAPRNRRLFHNGSIVLPGRVIQPGVLICESDRIQQIIPEEQFDEKSIAEDGQLERVDLRGGYLTPGLIDLHVHGGDGADFMDGTREAFVTVCRAHLRHGTTTLFPTTTTGSPAQIQAAIEACRAALDTTEGARIAGIHLYGPYFAEGKVGCHSEAGRREPQSAEYEAYFDSGLIRIATCAAELHGADAFYRAARRAGCLITCGHSNASWDEMQMAFDQGVRHVDHFWCAMSSVPSLRQRFNVPMRGSMAEFVLMNTDMSTEVIADGQHLAPELLEFAYRMLGPDRLCLVTDCNRGMDQPPGEYRFGNRHDGSWLYSDGQVGWSADRSSLASSIVGMDHMLRHMLRQTSCDVASAVRMATLTPAKRSGIADRYGSLEIGKVADLVMFDADFHVQSVYVSGQRRL